MLFAGFLFAPFVLRDVPFGGGDAEGVDYLFRREIISENLMGEAVIAPVALQNPQREDAIGDDFVGQVAQIRAAIGTAQPLQQLRGVIGVPLEVVRLFSQ